MTGRKPTAQQDESRNESQDESQEESRQQSQESQESQEESQDDSNDEPALEAELVDASEIPDVVELPDLTGAARGLPPRRTSSGAAGGRSSTLARYDPLEAYMRDVQRYRLLTPEETHDAAVKYFEQGDLEAAARLVTANLRLVVKIAYDYRRAHRHIPDLIQEGSIGLMQAVKKYDPYKGVKLSTYAAWWIRAYILRFILNNARLVKLGTTQAQRKLFFNLRKEKAKLTAMGIEPTPELIAQRLAVTTDEVVQMDRRLSAGDASLDTPMRNSEDGSGPSRVELLPGTAERADDMLASNEMSELFHEHIAEFGNKLAGKDKRIFDARMLTEDPLTLQQLGEEFGVSRERVRQLEKRLHVKLKEYLENELGADALEPR